MRRAPQALRSYQAELDAAQARLNLLYEDRLDGRIDAASYDRKAEETRQQQDRIQQGMQSAVGVMLPPIRQAVDLMLHTSEMAERFPEHSGEEQRRYLQLVLKGATWKGGELRMSVKEPFEKLRLSNSATNRN